MMPGPTQLIICAVIVVLLFGSKRVLEWARALGQAKGEFTKALEDKTT